MKVLPFKPLNATTVNIDVSGSSQRVAISNANIRIMNNGSATVWVNFGDSSVTAATTTGFPIGPGVTEIISPNVNGIAAPYVAVIAAGATGKIYFTPGSGL